MEANFGKGHEAKGKMQTAFFIQLQYKHIADFFNQILHTLHSPSKENFQKRNQNKQINTHVNRKYMRIALRHHNLTDKLDCLIKITLSTYVTSFLVIFMDFCCFISFYFLYKLLRRNTKSEAMRVHSLSMNNRLW